MEKIREEKKLQTFFDSHKSLNYKRNDIILSAGHNPQYLFFVKQGFIHSYLINATGSAFIVDWITENNFFPLSIFCEQNNNYYFQAYSLAEVKRIPKRMFMHFLEDNPDVLLYLNKKIAESASRILERLEHFLMSERIEDRLQYLILQLAKQFGTLEEGKTVIHMHLTHNDFASYIAATRESVTRSLTALVKAGIIRIEKDNIIANDLTTLEQKF